MIDYDTINKVFKKRKEKITRAILKDGEVCNMAFL